MMQPGRSKGPDILIGLNASCIYLLFDFRVTPNHSRVYRVHEVDLAYCPFLRARAAG